MSNPIIAEELRKIAEQHNNVLLPYDIVEAARDELHPLHSRFEWEDSKAAHAYRLEQARALIRVTVETLQHEGKEMTFRVFASLSTDRYEGGGYRSIVSIMKDESRRKTLLDDAMLDMERFAARYHGLAELQRVFEAIETTKREVYQEAS